MKKKVEIAKGQTVTESTAKLLRQRAGGSNVGKYSGVKKSDFAGTAGGVPGSFPINTLARAKSALKLAHNAPNPQAIKNAVYKKYPQLKPKNPE